MKHRILTSLFSALILGAVVSLVPMSAQALTSAEACPTQAGTRANPGAPGWYTYDPTLLTQSSTTDLVNCATPFKPVLVNNHQAPQDIELWFGPVPAAAFVGNTFTLRVVGTCEMQGYPVSMVVDKNTAHTTQAELVPLSTPNPYVLFNSGSSSCATSNATMNYSITVTDGQKAKIQQGDFAFLITAVGSAGLSDAVQEQVTSVSIPYSLINLSYDSNGGRGTNSTVNSGLQATLATNSFTKTGYSFSGWNTLADGSGTAYADAATATFSNDTTLYAQWAVATAPSGASLAVTGNADKTRAGLAGLFLVLTGISALSFSVYRRRIAQR